MSAETKDLKKTELCRLGDKLAESGKQPESISYYEQALEIDPNYGMALNNKGYALFEMGEYQEAISCFEKVLPTDPFYGLAQDNKGDAEYKQAKKLGLPLMTVRIRCKTCRRVSVVPVSVRRIHSKHTVCTYCGQMDTLEEL